MNQTQQTNTHLLRTLIEKQQVTVVDESNKAIVIECPFHSEQKGSLNINKIVHRSKPKGFFYCYGCAASGELPHESVDELAETQNEHVTAIPEPRFSVLQFEYWSREFQEDQAHELAAKWKVDLTHLLGMGVGWDGQAHTLPMHNEMCDVIGIQRQWPNGYKCMVTGTQLGLFIADNGYETDVLIVTEGASDLATAVQLGFEGIGKPNALVGNRLVYGYLKRHDRYERILIVGDNDEAGKRGAHELQDYIDSEHGRSAIWLPSTNDLRSDVKAHGRSQVKESLVTAISTIKFLEDSDATF